MSKNRARIGVRHSTRSVPVFSVTPFSRGSAGRERFFVSGRSRTSAVDKRVVRPSRKNSSERWSLNSRPPSTGPTAYPRFVPRYRKENACLRASPSATSAVTASNAGQENT
jgi:hypothetical protein